MSGRIKDVTDKTADLTPEARPRVFYLLWHEPLMTVGSSTGIHELIVLAGGTSIAQDLEEEYVLRRAALEAARYHSHAAIRLAPESPICGVPAGVATRIRGTPEPGCTSKTRNLYSKVASAEFF